MAIDIIKYRAGDHGPFDAIRRDHPSNRQVINLGHGIVTFCRKGDIGDNIKQKVLMRSPLDISWPQDLLQENCSELREIALRNNNWTTIKASPVSQKNKPQKIEKIVFFGVIGVKSPDAKLSTKGLDRAALFEKFTWLDPQIIGSVGPFKTMHDRIIVHHQFSWFPAELLKGSLAQLSNSSHVAVTKSGHQIKEFEGLKTLGDVIRILRNIAEKDKKHVIDISMAADVMKGGSYNGTPGIFITLSKLFGDQVEETTFIVPLNLKSTDIHVEEFGKES